MKLSRPELFRIAMTGIVLVAVIVLTHPCADQVSRFVTSFGSGSEAHMPKPGTVDEPQHYEQLKPGMTDEEVKAAIERAKARNSGAPSGEHGSAGSSR